MVPLFVSSNHKTTSGSASTLLQIEDGVSNAGDLSLKENRTTAMIQTTRRNLKLKKQFPSDRGIWVR